MTEITLLRAVGWLIQAWRKGIKNQTINACWVKSQLFGPLNGPHVHPRIGTNLVTLFANC